MKRVEQIKTGRKGKPHRGDIGVLCTSQSGVPLEGDGPYSERLARGLNRYRKEGWKFIGAITSTLLAFQRTK